MWWFNSDKRQDIWDEDIQWPIGDIEAAHKIRDICRSAADSAEKVAGFAGRPDNKKYKYESRTLRTRRQDRDGNRHQDFR